MIKIFIAGHNGMVGSAIHRVIAQDDEAAIYTADREKLDLLDHQKVLEYFSSNKFDQVYLAAAKVGGILANNTYPADFIYENLTIQNNVINSAFKTGVKKLLFLGSSCIYPKFAEQPIMESSLLTGILEPTNEAYAIAKIAGIKMCESYNRQFNVDFRSVMPTNLYGFNDNYHPTNSHVIPALIRKFHEGKINNTPHVLVWGSGNVYREFLFADDLATACALVMNASSEEHKSRTHPQQGHINIGSGEDISINQLANLIAGVVGFKGEIRQDTSKPDGTPRKLMDNSLIKSFGWLPKYSFSQGVALAYEDFQAKILLNRDEAKKALGK